MKPTFKIQKLTATKLNWMEAAWAETLQLTTGHTDKHSIEASAMAQKMLAAVAGERTRRAAR